MSLSAVSVRTLFTGTVSPFPPNNVSGAVVLKADMNQRYPNAGVLWGARIWFGAGEATFDFQLGTISLDTAGTRQLETVAITAAGGATSLGNLTLTVTGTYITGSPVTVLVPLSPARHGTADLIAAAVRKALASNSAIARAYTVQGVANSVQLKDRYPRANDGTLAIAITAGLGVSAATSSNTTAGVAGMIVERLGGNGTDAFGNPLPEANSVDILHFALDADANAGQNILRATGGDETFLTPTIVPGGQMTCSGNGVNAIHAAGLPAYLRPGSGEYGALDLLVSTRA